MTEVPYSLYHDTRETLGPRLHLAEQGGVGIGRERQ